jgi:ABC-type phosphate transport system substrate-binding protein
MKSLFRTVLFAAIALAAPAAYAEVVVIVSSRNTATTMAAEEIANIYLGKSMAMKPLDNGTAIRSEFYTKVAGKDEAQVKAIWSRLVFTGKATPPKELPTSADVVKAVAADPNAIGYVEKTAADSSVKVVLEVR